MLDQEVDRVDHTKPITYDKVESGENTYPDYTVSTALSNLARQKNIPHKDIMDYIIYHYGDNYPFNVIQCINNI